MSEKKGIEKKLRRFSISTSGNHGETKIKEIQGYGGIDVTIDIEDGLEGLDPHCHVGPKADPVDRAARRKLIIASIVCLLFMVGEAVGGILANSLAIATDAAHLLTDFASFMISLFALYIASRPATMRMSFGWYRAEVMGALISVLLIWVVTGVLVYMAVDRVITEDYEIDALVMLITAGVGVGVNIIMGCTLHDHGHSHGGHGHSHGGSATSSETSTDRQDESQETTSLLNSSNSDNKHKKETNINVRAAFIHVIGDFFQSLGVLVAAIIIYFKPEWKIADPICTFLFSVLVLITTINILRDTLNVLMEGTPRGLSYSEVRKCLYRIDGVKKVHNLRIWSLTMSKTALAVHLALEPDVNSQDVLSKAGILMRENFNIYECTIQVEQYVNTMADCDQCQDPTT